MVVLDVIRGNHNELCNLCKLVNAVYGTQNFLMVLSTFSICITQFYYCYDQGLDSDLVDIFFTLQWGFLQLIEVFTLAFICEKVQIKISSVKYVINKLLFKTSHPKIHLEVSTKLNFVFK